MRIWKGMAIVMTALGLLLGGIMTGCSVKEHIVDGPGMINPYEPLMDLLSDNWTTYDGRWTASIDGYALKLFFMGECVYDNTFDFSEHGGEDVNSKTELKLYYSDFQSDDGNVSGVIEQLYTENSLLYMKVRFKDGTDESPVFEKEEIHILDGDGTCVDNEPLLLALQGSWESADGIWGIVIEDYTLTILHEGQKVLYCDYYNFVFFSGSDINEHTELELPDYGLCHNGEECFASIENLYIENGALHMEVGYEGSESEPVTLEKSAK